MDKFLRCIAVFIIIIPLSACIQNLYALAGLSLILSGGGEDGPDGYTIGQNTPPLGIDEPATNATSTETITLKGWIFSGNDSKEWLYCSYDSPLSGVTVTWSNITNGSTNTVGSSLTSYHSGCRGYWTASDIPLEWGDNEILIVAVGNSGNSKQLRTTIRRMPESPTGTSVTIRGDNVTIKWNDVPHANTYDIYYSTSPGITTEGQAARVSNVISPYTLALPQNNTTYYISIAANHDNIVGFLSKEHIVTTGWYQFALDDLVDQGNTGGPLIDADVYDNLHIISDSGYITDSPGYWADVPLDINYYTPLAIDTDSSGRPHFLLEHSSNIVYTYLNSNDIWSTSVIDSASNIYYGFLVIDGSDHAHIVVMRRDASVIYLTNKSGEWVETSIDTDPSASGGHRRVTAISVDTVGFIHMTYFTDNRPYGNYEAWYATNQQGYWEHTLLKNSNYIPDATVAVDTNDTIHIIIDSTYVSKSSNSWSEEVNLPLRMYQYSLDVDSNSRLHIAGFSYQSTGLLYINNRNGEFQAQTLLGPDNLTISRGTDITVDSYSKIHIVYSRYLNVGSSSVKTPFYLTNRAQ